MMFLFFLRSGDSAAGARSRHKRCMRAARRRQARSEKQHGTSEEQYENEGSMPDAFSDVEVSLSN